jgi:hypothetical protein
MRLCNRLRVGSAVLTTSSVSLIPPDLYLYAFAGVCAFARACV